MLGDQRPGEPGRVRAAQGYVGKCRLADRIGAGMEPLHFGDDAVQPQPLDELHDIVMQPVLLADTEDRDDVGVVQSGGGAGLALKPP